MPQEFESIGGIHKEFTREMIDVALASEDVEEVIDLGLISLRNSLDEAVEADKPLLINLGMLNPNFNNVYTDDTIFPSSKIFNRDQNFIESLTRKLPLCPKDSSSATTPDLTQGTRNSTASSAATTIVNDSTEFVSLTIRSCMETEKELQ